MQLIVSNKLKIKGVPPELRQSLLSQLSYLAKRQDMYGCPCQETIKLYSTHKSPKDGQETITTYRGAVTLVVTWAKENSLDVSIEKDFTSFKPLDIECIQAPRDYQEDLINRVGDSHNGLIRAATGAGKTVTAIQLIARRKVPTLIICHTTDLVQQWRDSLSYFLGIPEKEIGQLGKGKKDIKPLTVGTYHTIVKMLGDKGMKQFGMIIADEAQYAGGKSYLKCVSTLKPQYLLGLSATPTIDGSVKPAEVFFGKQYDTLSRKELTDRGYLVDFNVKTRTFDVEGTKYTGDYSKQSGVLSKDETRNALVIKAIKTALRKDAKTDYDGVTIVLFERVEHIKTISKKLTGLGIDHSTVIGAINNKERSRIYSELKAGNGKKVLLGNIRICGAGLDIARLSSLVLAVPIASNGILQQAIGRIIRQDKGKPTATVYDIQDNGIFTGGAMSRTAFYEDEGVN